MNPGKAFEQFVKYILVGVGFSEITSDGLYIFDGAAGQMIQGLGEAHNADVLLEPPVQTPFYSSTRLLIECKDYKRKVGLNIVRSALGLREDINHFELVDSNVLIKRRASRRTSVLYNYTRYSYQVALASLSGFTVPAQEFAATHRIPLIEFDKMPYWAYFMRLLESNCNFSGYNSNDIPLLQNNIKNYALEISNKMAVAITNSGQMIFLYRIFGNKNGFGSTYSLYWNSKNDPWTLKTADNEYMFQLPDYISKIWLKNASDELSLKRDAINCKAKYLSNMVVYYRDHDIPTIKMISINYDELNTARKRLEI